MAVWLQGQTEMFLQQLEYELREVLILRDTIEDIGAEQVAQSFSAPPLSSLMRWRSSYDQLRLIDSTGMERLRLNRTDHGIVRVPNSQLQNKADRYYVRNCCTNPGTAQVCLSQIDLNVEAGKLELPYLPTLRILAPLRSRTGEHWGCTAVNVDFHSLIRYARVPAPIHGAEFAIADHEGHWLEASDQNQLWGFQLPERRNYRLSLRDPVAWEEISQLQSGHLSTAHGKYTFMWLELRKELSGLLVDNSDLEEDNRQQKLLFMAFLGADELEALFSPLAGPYKTVFLLAMVIWPPVTVLLAGLVLDGMARFRLLVRSAQSDPLTKVLNRGAFDSRLNDALVHARRHNRGVGVIFVDINNFKALNDRAGHATGDAVLVDAARTMRRAVRSSDVVARVGGDEFAVILWEVTGEAEARQALEKLRGLLGEVVLRHECVPPVGLGFGLGVATYPEDGQSAAELLALADERMYNDKRLLKA